MASHRSIDRRITARDLRYLWNDIVRELIAGQVFVIYHDKAPLARLLPVQGRSPAKERPALTASLPTAELVHLFDHQDLARMLGITESTWSVQCRQDQYSVKVLERLTFLSAQVQDLKIILPPSRLRSWFRRPRRELRGLSVIDHLAFPWNKDDRQATLVQSLVERAQFDATSIPDPDLSATPTRKT